MERLIIDRFEGGYAVCEKENGGCMDIPAALMPEGSEEGSCLILLDDGSFSLDKERTEARRKKIEDRFHNLFE